MNKILIIIKREYLSRVRKRSFIVMTIIGPLLMAGLFIVPIFIAQMSDETKVVEVIDESGVFYNRFPNTDNIKFEYPQKDIQTAKAEFHKSNYHAILYLPNSDKNMLVLNTVSSTARIFSEKQPSMNVKIYIEGVLKKELEKMKLEQSGIDKDVLASIETNVSIPSIKINDTQSIDGKEEKNYPEVSIALGIFSGILIYFFVFMFGSQVMRGVIEEKTSRIVEVIISSVKPFQLMMGKIVGVAMVGLTQFLLWIILTAGIIGVFQSVFSDKLKSQSTSQTFNLNEKALNPQQIQELSKQAPQESKLSEINNMIATINIPLMILSFIFFFICGYLLYASLFAAIGSAVDSEADTQQFMMPVTIPLIFSIVMLQFVINNPDGPVAFWLSMIPLTSPVIMMIRIPFGVPDWQLALSMGLLVIGFLISTWFAAKIYKTGILMYGKKVSYRELLKWLTYKS